jgi:hypothetical protein
LQIKTDDKQCLLKETVADHQDKLRSELERESSARAEAEAKFRESEGALKSMQAKSKQLITALQQRTEEAENAKVSKGFFL